MDDMRIYRGDPLHLLVKTREWNGDRPAMQGEEANSLVECRIFLNGVELEYATGIKLESIGGGFFEAQIGISPASITFEYEPRAEATE